MSDSARPEEYTEEYFLRNCGGAEFYRLYGARVLKPVAAYALKRADLKKGMKALDMGCGRGELLFHLITLGVEATGADSAPAALKLAAETSSAKLVRCDAKRLPFAAESFDRIFFLGVIDHLSNRELEQAFSEFKRVLKPGGFVLANTCTNKQYYKRLSYQARRSLALHLGLKEPSPPRSSEDETLHINEHNQRELEEFFSEIGWRGEIEPRPNDKYALRELYGDNLPDKFPLKPAPYWKQAYLKCVFSGPLKKYLAREFFCKLSPI